MTFLTRGDASGQAKRTSSLDRGIRLAAILALVVAVLAGCGKSAIDRAADQMGVSIAKLGLATDMDAILHDVEKGDQAKVDDAVAAYLKDARAAVKPLGKSEVARILADDANTLAGICDGCAAELDRVRETLQ